MSGVFLRLHIIFKKLLHCHVVRGECFIESDEFFDVIYSEYSKIISQSAKGDEQKIAIGTVKGKRFDVAGALLFFGRTIVNFQDLKMDDGRLNLHEVIAPS
jgi:hypothetical protein